MSSEVLARLAMAKMARVDPVPYDPRTGKEYKLLRVAIDSRCAGQSIPNGNFVEFGKGVYEVYENQLATVEALVEMASDAEMEFVQRDYEYHVAECKGELGKGSKPCNSRQYMPSFPASFLTVQKRELMPFISLEVLPGPDDLPEPAPRKASK